ncbi:MAG: adenylylsulfate kinase [Candidatus Petromonas sp.]|jgi:adenylylsulfate kinase|nr:adenylylsulfate kinase [Candidatus Petromonas sp.]
MESQKSQNIVWHRTNITKKDREKLLNQKGALIWFTGLSGSGKSTVASALEQRLFELGKLTYLLDGDNIRHGLNSDLGFSIKDRKENIRRIGEVSKLFVDAGVIVIASFISPLKEDRNNVRNLLERNFVEIYVDCPLDICERRDPKGLYKKARKGEIKDFTGIYSPYEKPENPEITIHTNSQSIDECVETILRYLKKKFL